MKIVVGVDEGRQCLDAVALAATLADAFDAELVVAHVPVWDWGGPGRAGMVEQASREDALAIVERAGAGLDRPYTPRVMPSSSAAAGLHSIVEREPADLLVLGSTRRGAIGRVLLGGVAEPAVHGLPCALAVAPKGYADYHGDALQRIGVAYDASPESRSALHWAEDLAARAPAGLMLYRVLQVPHLAVEDDSFEVAETAVLDDLGRRHRQELDDALEAVPEALSPHSRLLEGPVAPTLADAAEKDDLLVMGARGHSAVGTMFLGSVSRSVLHRAGCPVVVLPRGAPHGDAGAEVVTTARHA